MQERGQNSMGEQALADAAGEVSPEPLAIFSCTLAVIRGVSGLLNAGACSLEGEESWVGETFVGKVELHPRGKGLGVRLKHIDIGYKAENALLFFSFELLGSNLL
jgi:hypothetical protein